MDKTTKIAIVAILAITLAFTCPSKVYGFASAIGLILSLILVSKTSKISEIKKTIISLIILSSLFMFVPLFCSNETYSGLVILTLLYFLIRYPATNTDIKNVFTKDNSVSK